MIEIKLDASGSLDLLVALSEFIASDSEVSISSVQVLYDLHESLFEKLLYVLVERGVDD